MCANRIPSPSSLLTPKCLSLSQDVRSPILDVLQCSDLCPDFEREGEFCAGHLGHHPSYRSNGSPPPRFRWTRNGSVPELLESFDDYGIKIPSVFTYNLMWPFVLLSFLQPL